MPTQENKDVVRRVFEEMVDRGRLELADELIADDVEIHSPVPGAESGREGFRDFIGGFLAGFPEQRTELHEFICEGDRVAVRHTHHAVNTGEFLGMPPTGRTIAVSGIEIFRLRNGKVAEFWHADDLMGPHGATRRDPRPRESRSIAPGKECICRRKKTRPSVTASSKRKTKIKTRSRKSCAPPDTRRASPPMDFEGHSQFGLMFYGAFPDLHHTIEATIAEEDRVAVRFTLSGTHEGDFMGVPATGRSVTVSAIAILKTEGGRVTELHGHFDAVGLMQQLGAIPAPETAGA